MFELGDQVVCIHQEGSLILGKQYTVDFGCKPIVLFVNNHLKTMYHIFLEEEVGLFPVSFFELVNDYPTLVYDYDKV